MKDLSIKRVDPCFRRDDNWQVSYGEGQNISINSFQILKMKKVGIIGGTGFVGGHLKKHFLEKGDEVSVYGHTLLQLPAEGVREQLRGCNIIVNLAGASIAKRWTKKQKELIYTSRIASTQLLVAAINQLEEGAKPEVMISASAVGYYPQGSILVSEDTAPGDDFLAQVCKDWEGELSKIEGNVRTVRCRFGVVLAADGGALPQMLLPFRLGVTATFGSGRQHFSWIHIADLVRVIELAAENSQLTGAVNTMAPESPTYAEVAQLTEKHFATYIRLRFPTWLMKILMGEGHVSITGDKSAFPKKLMDVGFEFKFPTLSSALDEVLTANKL